VVGRSLNSHCRFPYHADFKLQFRFRDFLFGSMSSTDLRLQNFFRQWQLSISLYQNAYIVKSSLIRSYGSEFYGAYDERELLKGNIECFLLRSLTSSDVSVMATGSGESVRVSEGGIDVSLNCPSIYDVLRIG
jgi:hypothetical protein